MSAGIRIDTSAPRNHSHDGTGGIPQVSYGNLLKPTGLVTVGAANADYTTIAAAVAAASAGNTILIYPGTYTEQVDASAKALHFVVVDPENTLLTYTPASAFDYALKVKAGTSVTGLKINCIKEDNTWGEGIYISPLVAGEVAVKNCSIVAGQDAIYVINDAAEQDIDLVIDGGYYEGSFDVIAMLNATATSSFRGRNFRVKMTGLSDSPEVNGLYNLPADTIVDGCFIEADAASGNAVFYNGITAAGGAVIANTLIRLVTPTASGVARGVTSISAGSGAVICRNVSIQLTGMQKFEYRALAGASLTTDDMNEVKRVGPGTVTQTESGASTAITETEVIDEVVDFTGGNEQSLANSGLVPNYISPGVDITVNSDILGIGTEYIETTDWTLNLLTGTITRVPEGSMPAGPVYVTYKYYASAVDASAHQSQIMLYNGFATFTSNYLTMYRWAAKYTPSKMGKLVAAYFEIVAWLPAGGQGTVHLRKDTGSGDTAVASIAVTAAAEDGTATVRSADILSALGTTDGLIYIGRDNTNANGVSINMARLVLEFER